MTPTELYLLATTVTCAAGNVLLGERLIAWKCRALELQAEAVHSRLGRVRFRRRFRAASFMSQGRNADVRNADGGSRARDRSTAA